MYGNFATDAVACSCSAGLSIHAVMAIAIVIANKLIAILPCFSFIVFPFVRFFPKQCNVLHRIFYMVLRVAVEAANMAFSIHQAKDGVAANVVDKKTISDKGLHGILIARKVIPLMRISVVAAVGVDIIGTKLLRVVVTIG